MELLEENVNLTMLQSNKNPAWHVHSPRSLTSIASISLQARNQTFLKGGSKSGMVTHK